MSGRESIPVHDVPGKQRAPQSRCGALSEVSQWRGRAMTDRIVACSGYGRQSSVAHAGQGRDQLIYLIAQPL